MLSEGSSRPTRAPLNCYAIQRPFKCELGMLMSSRGPTEKVVSLWQVMDRKQFPTMVSDVVVGPGSSSFRGLLFARKSPRGNFCGDME